ncbi:hypothetical protein GAP32_149 [Cronobacter phage vB_CsaM_GAP32]|uniref:DUF4326 domain-containing protein n=1 Tax=Cronobacter phage vB_CsaM_GAP32 TaxID=1141136 RepID=K4FB24_9CAUD|nr:hypothetical protein GAP32_149 [Cronobacter phage vB_CsaM_GAP32]AFC21599.1 hypothetical protein GAP32_149 [Cronobacter phage vB_CsaM_GAP32]
MEYITPVLINRHKGEFDVYIGRGTIWGNPHPIDPGQGISRQISIEMYREHLYKCLEDGTITVKDVLSLSGKRIGCSCSPLPCHGDVIIEVFNCIVEMLEE